MKDFNLSGYLKNNQLLNESIGGYVDIKPIKFLKEDDEFDEWCQANPEDCKRYKQSQEDADKAFTDEFGSYSSNEGAKRKKTNKIESVEICDGKEPDESQLKQIQNLNLTYEITDQGFKVFGDGKNISEFIEYYFEDDDWGDNEELEENEAEEYDPKIHPGRVDGGDEENPYDMDQRPDDYDEDAQHDFSDPKKVKQRLVKLIKSFRKQGDSDRSIVRYVQNDLAKSYPVFTDAMKKHGIKVQDYLKTSPKKEGLNNLKEGKIRPSSSEFTWDI